MSSSGGSTPTHAIPYSSTVGALFFGSVFQSIGYGILCALLWYYAMHSRQDPCLLKLSIFATWILCTFILALTIHSVDAFIMQISVRPGQLLAATWTTSLLMVVVAVVTLIVRFIYISRLWRLYRRRGEFSIIRTSLLVLVALLCLTDLGGSIGITVKIIQHPSAHTPRTLTALIEAVFGAGFAADVILTFILCMWLHKSKTGSHRADSVINTMIVYIINSGLLPAFVETAGMITFLCSRRNFIYIAIYIQLGNLYLISLLALLNSRTSVRRLAEQPASVNFAALTRPTTTDGSRTSPPSTISSEVSLRWTDTSMPIIPSEAGASKNKVSSSAVEAQMSGPAEKSHFEVDLTEVERNLGASHV